MHEGREKKVRVTKRVRLEDLGLELRLLPSRIGEAAGARQFFVRDSHCTVESRKSSIVCIVLRNGPAGLHGVGPKQDCQDRCDQGSHSQNAEIQGHLL